MRAIPWTALKTIATTKSLPFQYIDIGTYYVVWLVDASLVLSCDLPKDSEEYSEFDSTYKAKANVNLTSNVLPFASKVLPNGKKLFARNTGVQQAVTTGATIINHTVAYPQVKMIGAEVIGGEALDYINFEVYDTAQGTYSGVPNAKLNQFGFSVNIAPGFYRREAPYDADLYQGMILRMTYNSVSNKTIGINLILNEVKD